MSKVQENGTYHQSKLLKSNGHSSQSNNGYYTGWDDALPLPKLSFRLAAVIVFAVGVLCFANSYDGMFVFDDSEAIIGNKDLQPDTPIEKIFEHDFWGKKLDSKTSHKSYRPLTVLTFRWSYSLAGGLNPMGFHVVNIFLHGIVSALMLRVFSLILSGYSLNPDTGGPMFGSPKASLLCAVLFAVHPIHTESVAGVVGRADLLCALLFIASFLCYVRGCAQELSRENTILNRPTSFSFVYLLVSMLLCGLSVLCKEQGITVIGICSAYDIIMVCRLDILFILGLKSKKKLSVHSNGHVNGTTDSRMDSRVISTWVKSLILRQAFLLLWGSIILITRWRVMGSVPPKFMVVDNPHSFLNSTVLRAVNYNYIYSLNGLLLVNPWWLCFDWSMGCVPVIQSLTDIRILSVIAFWIVLGGLVVTALCGKIAHEQRCLTMALALLIVPFLPATNLLFRVGFVIAERVLYMSTAGYCVLVVLGFNRIASDQRFSQVSKHALIFLVVVFMVRSIQRSNEWRHEMPLFLSGAKVCPLNAKVHYNIAKLNGDRGNSDVAVAKYRHAIHLQPDYDQAMNNLANMLKDRDEAVEAEQLLLKAVSIREDFAAAWMNLGIVQAGLKKSASAENSYWTAIKHRRNYPDCYYNLGNLYLALEKHQKALQAWRNATILKPSHYSAWSNMVILLDDLNRLDDAVKVGKEALKYVTNEPQLHNNLANVYGKAEKYKESEHHFLKALQMDPNNIKAHSNLGVLYHRWGKFELAEKSYQKALQLEPNLPSTKENLHMLYRKTGKAGQS